MRLFSKHKKQSKDAGISKAQVEKWVEEQIRQGKPRQEICQWLYGLSSEYKSEVFVQDLRAWMRDEGPWPERFEAMKIFSQVADELFRVMVDRNLRGRELEKDESPDREKSIETAIELYKANVVDRFDGVHLYDRLRIIYTRNKQYAAAIRVCQAYLDLPDRKGQDKERFRQHLEKLKAKIR